MLTIFTIAGLIGLLCIGFKLLVFAFAVAIFVASAAFLWGVIKGFLRS